MSEAPRSPLVARAEAGECLGVAWLCLGSAALVEIAARARPDAIVIDRQHGLWERRELEAAIAMAGDVPVIVRVAENGAAAIGEALDSGAHGIMVPLVETPAQARSAVRFARFPPRGDRSGGGVRASQDFAAFHARAARTLVITMIETSVGVGNAAVIAAVPDLDLLFVGPGDLALSLGVAQDSPSHARACGDVLDACRATGRPCGIFTRDALAARRRRSEGYALVVVASDVSLAVDGFAGAASSFRSP